MKRVFVCLARGEEIDGHAADVCACYPSKLARQETTQLQESHNRCLDRGRLARPVNITATHSSAHSEPVTPTLSDAKLNNGPDNVIWKTEHRHFPIKGQIGEWPFSDPTRFSPMSFSTAFAVQTITKTKCNSQCIHSITLYDPSLHLPGDVCNCGVPLIGDDVECSIVKPTADALLEAIDDLPPWEECILTFVARQTQIVACAEGLVVMFKRGSEWIAYLEPPLGWASGPHRPVVIRPFCSGGWLCFAASLADTPDETILSHNVPASLSLYLACMTCGNKPLEFAIEVCGHLTRCLECSLQSRTCPLCCARLRRRPRNADAVSASSDEASQPRAHVAPAKGSAGNSSAAPIRARRRNRK